MLFLCPQRAWLCQAHGINMSDSQLACIGSTTDYLKELFTSMSGHMLGANLPYKYRRGLHFDCIYCILLCKDSLHMAGTFRKELPHRNGQFTHHLALVYVHTPACE